MRNAALQHSLPPCELVPAADELHERRTPAIIARIDLAAAGAEAKLKWPVSWPATLHCGELGASCEVQAFCAETVHLTMNDPPPVGVRVSLKFPFTIYLHGRVAWCRGKDLGLEFDPEVRRSARIVEDVLLDGPASG